MKHISIIGKFLSIIAVFAAFVLGAAFFTTGKMRVIDTNYSDLSDHQGAASVTLARASRTLWATRSGIADLIISQTPDTDKAAIALIAASKEQFVGFMDGSAALLPDHAAAFNDLKAKGLQAINTSCAETMRLAASNDAAVLDQTRTSYNKACGPDTKAAADAIKTMVDNLLVETKRINDATSDITNATILTTWATILGGLAVVAALGFVALRMWVSTPINALARNLSAIAGGAYDTAIEGAERRDEIGTIAKVAQVFKVTGTEKIALEAETARQREAAETLRRQEERERQDAAAKQETVVTGLGAGLVRLSDGDLTVRLVTPFPAEYEKLRDDFNAAIDKLQTTIVTVVGATGSIRSGTSEISSAADDLSRRTEQQAASLEETAAALDQITATVKRTSEGALEARSAVASTKADAEQSGDVVGRAVQAMSAIESSSQQISQIIGVIDEIAFQTNLLALNAGVEAARAGEAGRGFAVVASEVRALAQRSAEAAKDIKGLISASRGHVDQGVALVGETGKALERIVGQVTAVSRIISDIAASAQEQAAGLDQVNTAINQMDQVTQQNAANGGGIDGGQQEPGPGNPRAVAACRAVHRRGRPARPGRHPCPARHPGAANLGSGRRGPQGRAHPRGELGGVLRPQSHDNSLAPKNTGPKPGRHEPARLGFRPPPQARPDRRNA
ncbi:methyl-accepting chemotaxis protein [Lichenihabitans sp. Uapishka_5]|uniref:methyl-accepting chemotaxis protein n=1 Tax=Lichenihabitans sp. Uapishka_5 TaxID=3037302 RepID=UPI0029E822D5|nr:methyl-accepting chemotaxis protein [Lichenihabitans sp. Uapishka_5]MDX7953649.1 methyl-accepting chemotaxis protein [Lichenihabitans sp. Uapishka_5]